MAAGECSGGTQPEGDGVSYSLFPDGIYMDGATPASERYFGPPSTETERAHSKARWGESGFDRRLYDPGYQEIFLAVLALDTREKIANGTLPDDSLVPYEPVDDYL